MEKNKKKKFLIIISILLIGIILLLVFKNNIEAQYKGIDVKYLNNPQYCEQDSDCLFEEKSCTYVNKFNYKFASTESCFASSTPNCIQNVCSGSNRGGEINE